MIEELRESYLNRKKTEVLLRKLEELKENISDIETRYNILQADYTDICQSAITKINTLRDELREDIGRKVGDIDIFKPTISNLEARRKLGISSDSPPSDQKNVDSVHHNSSNIVQKGVDIVASSIEYGLDGIGNVVIFIGEWTIKLITAPFRFVRNRKHW